MRRTLPFLALLLAAPAAHAWVAILPGAVEGLGQPPAVFSSTVYLSNPGPQDAVATFELIPYAGRPTPSPVTRPVPAGASLVIDRALKTLFDISADAGALRVSADTPLVGSIVTANVANPESTYGVALSPVVERDFLRFGDTGHAPWVSQGGGFRTNVAVVLVEPRSVVTVLVFDAAGTLAGQREIESETPVSWQVPVTDLIGPRDLFVGRVEFLFARGRGTGYVAVNDDVTGDAIAVQAPRQPSTDQILDGVARTSGANGTFWRTDARVFNPNASPISISVEPFGLPSAPTLALEVPARSILDLPDVLSRFGVSAPAAGALRFRAGAPFLVFGRTQNVDPTGQRPGTFAASQAAVPVPAGLLSPDRPGTLGGVEQSSRFRTNLALLATENGAAGTMTLRGPAGEAAATAPFALAPGTWQQKGVGDWFPGAGFPAGSRVDVAVSAGALDGYLSRIDNATGDPVVLGTAVATPTVSDVLVTSFVQRPDPIVSSRGGTLVAAIRNDGPDGTEGPLEISLTTTVTQGNSKLVFARLTGDTALDWTLVSGTYGVSQTIHLRRKSALSSGATTQVEAVVGVPGGGAVGGSFPGNRVTVAVPSDPIVSNNSRTLVVDMAP